MPIPFREMRRIIPTTFICFVVTACGGAAAMEPAPVAAPAPPSTAATTTTTIPSTTTTATTETQNELNTDTLPEGASLVFKASGAVDVFSDPDDEEPFLTLEPTTILGTVTVLAVLEGPEEGWARVMLPGRPNGSEGWVEVVETMLSVVNGQLVVDLSERTLTYYEAGDEVLVTTVAVGSSRNPTPTGSFFITDNVTLADPNSPWGPHAFGLSARSETVTEYNGGDGIIGIHGTNKPGSIGNAASLGCVRVPNEVITELHEVIPIGTPVEIRA
ncbi:MAG: L,D-transpeptidase [Actinomycetota bacterium]|nr:L,D-transpeptidase [Actinomycetota bacterium]